MLPDTSFHKHGKLLLTAEYFILDGVAALAVPTKLGQTFTVATAEAGGYNVSWRAYTNTGEVWLREVLHAEDWAGPQDAKREGGKARLCQLFAAAERLRPGCTPTQTAVDITTQLGFNQQWGLGSSSTLVAAFAQWLGVNPYALLEATFGGSGYDLACADAAGPILYERNGSTPKVTPLDWRPEWVKGTHFVYRNQKQNSREGIRAYRKAGATTAAKKEIGRITTALLQPALHLRAAAQLLREHEQIVGETLGLMPVQQEYFADFPGQLKSLGAWGGDFIWAVSPESDAVVRAYFNERGFGTVIGYEDMVL